MADEHTLNQALMIGANNKAWVPCIYAASSPTTVPIAYGGHMSNPDDTDVWWSFILPLPTVKGGLKLYISGLRVDLFDADAGDYVDTRRIYGGSATASTELVTEETTNLISQGQYDWTFTAVDCSSYGTISSLLQLVVTNAYDLKLTVAIRCYYA